jgi:hypothetical protein
MSSFEPIRCVLLSPGGRYEAARVHYLVGGAVVAYPFFARSQERIRRVGVLMAFPEDDPEAKEWLAAFREGLERRGWFEGSSTIPNPPTPRRLTTLRFMIDHHIVGSLASELKEHFGILRQASLVGRDGSRESGQAYGLSQMCH